MKVKGGERQGCVMVLDRAELMKVMNDMSQGILNDKLGTWKGEQESDNSEAEERSKPMGDRDHSSSALLGNAKEVVQDGPPPPPEGQCFQNAVDANPPGRQGLLLEGEGVEADEFQ